MAYKNHMCKVVTSPSPANRRMNANVKTSLSPSKANRSMNAPAKVKPMK
jgi:hypothetical protein